MLKRLKTTSGVLLLAGVAMVAAACGGANTETANTNTNATGVNANVGAAGAENSMTAETRVGPDNSEIRTENTGGVRTETRTFRDTNSPVERVVVTTRDGRRTARVYYRDRTVRELPEDRIESALNATGDALVAAGGRVVDVSKEIGAQAADKTEDALDEAADKAEDVGGAAARGAKKVGSEAADKAEDVGDKAASGAKKVGKEAVKGAKKVGDAITP
ncbi:MAG TPA: hypothetical protein VEY09_09545 [Pyrinomonadaceae bacterium]|nr:hypothetical protein [Pyrinomonadaceae bacterium]